MKNVNWLKWLIVIAFISFILPSCLIFRSPEKKDDRKDDQAVARVLADRDLADKVYFKQAKLHPCEDSIVRYLPGRTDSIPYPVLVVDYERINRVADSVRNIYKENNLSDALRQAAKAGYDEAVSEYAKRKIPLPVHDTLYRDDGRKVEAWKVEAQSWKEKFIAQQAVNTASKESMKGKISFQWWLAILFAVVLIGIGYVIGKIK